MRSWMAVPLVALGTFAAGCAGSSTPVVELNRTDAALRAAREVNAHRIPRAALHIKMAEDQREVARRFIANGEEDEASAALDRATLDAELAVALAKEERARKNADEIQSRASALRTGATIR